jgi:hypothetical protein
LPCAIRAGNEFPFRSRGGHCATVSAKTRRRLKVYGEVLSDVPRKTPGFAAVVTSNVSVCFTSV